LQFGVLCGYQNSNTVFTPKSEFLCQNQNRNIRQLRRHITQAWVEFDLVVIETAISLKRARLAAYVEAEVGHYEHTLKHMINM